MNEKQRQESAAKKVVDLMLGGLKGVTSFQAIELPIPNSGMRGDDVRNRRTVLALCFPAELWDFDGKKFIRRDADAPVRPPSSSNLPTTDGG